jgi:hypothetical protein
MTATPGEISACGASLHTCIRSPRAGARIFASAPLGLARFLGLSADAGSDVKAGP